jgi:O-methyltransferase involved in polyketide biosynthesis
MALSAAHWVARAAEARAIAWLCDDPALRAMMEEIAREYDALAACRYRANRAMQGATRQRVLRGRPMLPAAAK